MRSAAHTGGAKEPVSPSPSDGRVNLSKTACTGAKSPCSAASMASCAIQLRSTYAGLALAAAALAAVRAVLFRVSLRRRSAYAVSHCVQAALSSAACCCVFVVCKQYQNTTNALLVSDVVSA
jgi:hypothetical protein